MANAQTNPANRKHNGHRNLNCWKVYLHLSGSYDTDRLIGELVAEHGTRRAADILHEQLKDRTTSDGARFTKVAVGDAVRELAA